ncbi:putative mitochondrial hypothetical protein [Leptomonas pyrrhocoris]|uniref:Transmembrane protein n=1 Tax=Leptomonas pyrrhocoris TaxID=157538 RepID=A0A0M9G6Y2_LEPPY|nr:putative mitochondrial hypothetical protein [Leptomonas pyrrhocoris]XP_015662280.1 putative mitochondrial hypothetical protein [Leptomonas pyrrhocoris]KPA83840.1 putative mitochondrial hypothetical protein [Leptomonas pyrrhocoris]KPA83841.1 putative mitochondrial hypothetical protein [Leptomonas pyrrhocoris]|eukprot:XP_015662279.1 putative mitochondrial hypothetical protein [Leptomonas pyrrhocoris]
MTLMRMGNAHEPRSYTSKDAGGGPQRGAGHDPVFAAYVVNKLTGPLKRKMGNQPEDFLNVDEASKWMDAKHAAKVLGIKEEDLPKLNREVLEEKWRKTYKERTNAQQEEVLIATEVLLEYLDSSVFMKKSRQYYRKFIDNARAEVEQELTTERRNRNQSLMWLFGFAMTGACFVVLFVAFSRRYVTRKDVHNIGAKTSEYFVMTFLQPKNPEPKPDYNTRYFNTPTSMEIDQKSGRYANQFMGDEAARHAAEAAAYTERESAEVLKLFNDERERGARDTQNELARESRVAVYLPEEVHHGEPRPVARADTPTAFEKMTFRDFSNMLASNFGGGSRFQRLTEETSARSDKLYSARERLGVSSPKSDEP